MFTNVNKNNIDHLEIAKIVCTVEILECLIQIYPSLKKSIKIIHLMNTIQLRDDQFKEFEKLEEIYLPETIKELKQTQIRDLPNLNDSIFIIIK